MLAGLNKRTILASIAVVLLAGFSATYLANTLLASPPFSATASSQTAADPTAPAPRDSKATADVTSTVELSETQVHSVTIETVGTHRFPVETKAVGAVAYHERYTAHNAHSYMLPWRTDNDMEEDDDASPKVSAKVVVANVAESDSPIVHVEQPVAVKVLAYPDRVFEGKVFALGGTVWDSGGNPAVDPNTHRITIRCAVADPKNELHPGMLANVVIQVREPAESLAIPMNGVVRKGDGTMTAWVTKDRRHFEERTIKVGLQHNGYDQILVGLKPEELVATDGAIFLNNLLYAPPSD